MKVYAVVQVYEPKVLMYAGSYGCEEVYYTDARYEVVKEIFKNENGAKNYIRKQDYGVYIIREFEIK